MTTINNHRNRRNDAVDRLTEEMEELNIAYAEHGFDPTEKTLSDIAFWSELVSATISDIEYHTVCINHLRRIKATQKPLNQK